MLRTQKTSVALVAMVIVAAERIRPDRRQPRAGGSLEDHRRRRDFAGCDGGRRFRPRQRGRRKARRQGGPPDLRLHRGRLRSRRSHPERPGKIKAKLDTKDFAGPISKSILVMTDDPQNPTVTLVIKADIRPFIEILPRPLIRFNAVLHEPMNQTFIVVGADPEEDISVRSVDSSVPFHHDLDASARRGRTHRGKVEIPVRGHPVAHRRCTGRTGQRGPLGQHRSQGSAHGAGQGLRRGSRDDPRDPVTGSVRFGRIEDAPRPQSHRRQQPDRRDLRSRSRGRRSMIPHSAPR